MSNTKFDEAFIGKGFTNWKKALSKDGFVAHEHSKCHQEAVTRSILVPSCSYGKVPAMMLTWHEKTMQENRQMFLKILSNVQYLGMSYSFRIMIAPKYILLRYRENCTKY